MKTHSAAWQAWFEEASAASSGGDLAFLADEAQTQSARIAARVAAIESLLDTRSLRSIEHHIAKLAGDDPEQAQPYREQLAELEAASFGSLPPAFIFSGHMVDTPQRGELRFPPGAVVGIAGSIHENLLACGATSRSVATCSAAAGADLLFIEAALALGIKTAVCLPFAEERFLATSVTPAGNHWVQRYRRMARADGVIVRALPLDPPPGSDPYERCNRWMVNLALAGGPRTVQGIVVWDGEDGDGPGGTGHMVAELRAYNIPVLVTDPGTVVS